jgi:phosphatidylserine/phosphatidylglycerophosphate/cardiolipin synthase-like enzyme
LHCQIDGPAAYDILTNFEERWLKASKPRGMQKLKASFDDALLKLERIDEILGIAELPSLAEDDPEAWNVQVLNVNYFCLQSWIPDLVHMRACPCVYPLTKSPLTEGFPFY